MFFLLLLQTLAFFVMPWLLGRVLLLLVQPRQAHSVLLSYLSGALSLFVGVLVLRYVFALQGTALTTWFFGGVWVATLGSAALACYQPPRLSKLQWPPIFALIVTALLSYFLWTWQSPYPLNWDFYQHQQLARLISGGEFSFLTTEMSDTFGFNSYPPFFHVLLAVSQYPFVHSSEDLLNFWQLLSFWQIVLVGVAAYFLASSVTSKSGVGLLAAVSSMLIFDSEVSLTTYFMMPQTLAAVMFVLLLAKLLQTMEQTSYFEVILGAVSLIFMHYLVGGVGALVYISVALYIKFLAHLSVKIQRIPWGIGVMVLVGVAACLAQNLSLGDLNQGEGAAYAMNFTTVRQALERAFAYFAYVFVPLGMWWLWCSPVAFRKKEVLSVLFFSFAVVVFSGLPYALKLMSIWRFFLLVFMAMGVFFILSQLKQTWSKVLVVLIFLGVLLTNLVVNLSYFHSGILAEGIYTHVGQNDIVVATWLSDRYANDTILLSDPSTQFILEGLSGVDSVAGAYMPLEKRRILWKPLYSRNAGKIVAAARELTATDAAKQRLLILSGRSLAWARANDEQWQSFTYNVWSPIAFAASDKQLIAQISQQAGVKLVYQNASVAIWEVSDVK